MRYAGLQGMRDQTVVMHPTESSGIFGGIAEKAQAMLFEGASFVMGLGFAYLAVCYGIPIPTQEEFQESNP
jgi:hypothetical protein